MNSSLFKTIVLAGITGLVWNCSDDSSTKADSSSDPISSDFLELISDAAESSSSITVPVSSSLDTPSIVSSSSTELPLDLSSSDTELPLSASSSSTELPASSSDGTEPPLDISSSSSESTSSSSSDIAELLSSSSVAIEEPQSSSSSEQEIAISPNYKVKEGGNSGEGWGSRYWDCCMPHCAWSKNTSNPTKVCNAKMEVSNESIGSVCDNGYGGVCDTQAPWAVNDQFAFAFAAVPAKYGGTCGKCYLLTFDGKRHNADPDVNTEGLVGKKMIIMVSNIGGDVDDGQFDIMIPGGGVGLFNGCEAQLGVTEMGKQYGGFISDCKHDAECIIEKCKVFSNYPKIQAGCEFSAIWMNGASNPTFKYEELESCPEEISSKW